MEQKIASIFRDQGLLARLQQSWARDRDQGMWVRLSKAVRAIRQLFVGQLALRHCNEVGSGPRVEGRIRVENQGFIRVGDSLGLTSHFIPTELVTGPAGRIEIGNSVWINFGAVIAARQLVTIGDESQIGQHCIISDVEIPETATAAGIGDSKPIRIGKHVWLAGRVTVRPGVTIGDRTVVIAGSIVESDLPPDVIAGGIPARVIRSLTEIPASASAAASAFASAAAATQPRAEVKPVNTAFSGLLISDFTIDDLVPELLRDDFLPRAAATVAPYDQVTQTLLATAAGESGASQDFAVVWTRPAGAVPAYGRIVRFEDVEEEELLAQVDGYTSLIAGAAKHFRAVFVPTWVAEPWRRGLGVSDMRRGGVGRALAAMNLRMMSNLSGVENVYVLNADRWMRSVGPTAANPKAWYLGKMAFTRAALTEAALDIRAGLANLSGGPRKLLVLDLDDTLWGGVVGDVGWQGLRLGALDGLGEAFVDFQAAVKDLKRRGVVLAIVSKNEESVAPEAIRHHPEMVLREEDFVGWRINWTDKARNIADLASELNLGLQSVVFIDDNPVERSRVRDALPEVLVPEWPEDKFLYRSALESLRCFDSAARTREDSDRTRLYTEEQQRERLKREVGSLSDWLKGLDIRVRADRLGPANIARAAQLLNKTNQLNLSTRRLTEQELLAWTAGEGREFWTVSVSDRLGDSGLTGLVSIESRGDTARIVDYVLSCRVMGRKVEETMLHMAVRVATSAGASQVIASYLPTPKNKPCLTVLNGSGFDRRGDNEFFWDSSREFALPEAITLEWNP